jgi:hypothetical protein
MSDASSLDRRREWAQSGRDMLARSIAAGHRPNLVHRLTRKQYAAYILSSVVRQSHALQAARRGKRRPLSEVQAATTGRNRKAVTLAPVSLLECEL